MEEDKNVDMQVSSGSSASSRWNPTKEQINMLEVLYRQGMRTPNAEQIQQITSRLQVYGHIEGKNVFYWFQNHKARQRQKQKQKQKQESISYFNRFLHKSPSPCTNVVCSPFYTPHSGVGYYPQYPKMLLPGVIKRRPNADKIEKMKVHGSAGAGYKPVQSQPQYQVMHTSNANEEKVSHETLALFPLHPTGILEGNSGNSIPSNSERNLNPCGNQTFFDFFAKNGSCESD